MSGGVQQPGAGSNGPNAMLNGGECTRLGVIGFGTAVICGVLAVLYSGVLPTGFGGEATGALIGAVGGTFGAEDSITTFFLLLAVATICAVAACFGFVFCRSAK